MHKDDHQHAVPPRLSRAALARELGVDKAMVTRHAKRGMPVHSVEAAKAWRAENLSLAHRKDMNPARDWHRFKAGTPAADRESLERVAKLMEVGEAALKAGRFELVRGAIVEAMSAVPSYLQAQCPCSIAVMDALCDPVIRAVGKGQALSWLSAPLPNEEEADMGAFWFSAAIGEVVPGQGQPR